MQGVLYRTFREIQVQRERVNNELAFIAGELGMQYAYSSGGRRWDPDNLPSADTVSGGPDTRFNYLMRCSIRVLARLQGEEIGEVITLLHRPIYQLWDYAMNTLFDTTMGDLNSVGLSFPKLKRWISHAAEKKGILLRTTYMLASEGRRHFIIYFMDMHEVFSRLQESGSSVFTFKVEIMRSPPLDVPVAGDEPRRMTDKEFGNTTADNMSVAAGAEAADARADDSDMAEGEDVE